MFVVPSHVYVCKPVVVEKRIVEPKKCKMVQIKCDQQSCVFPTEQFLDSLINDFKSSNSFTGSQPS